MIDTCKKIVFCNVYSYIFFLSNVLFVKVVHCTLMGVAAVFHVAWFVYRFAILNNCLFNCMEVH